MKHLLALLLCVVGIHSNAVSIAADAIVAADVVVDGGTPAGVMAAIPECATLQRRAPIFFEDE